MTLYDANECPRCGYWGFVKQRDTTMELLANVTEELKEDIFRILLRIAENDPRWVDNDYLMGDVEDIITMIGEHLKERVTEAMP